MKNPKSNHGIIENIKEISLRNTSACGDKVLPTVPTAILLVLKEEIKDEKKYLRI